MQTRWARCAPVPVMTNTLPIFRPTAASFSPTTPSPTLPSSLNDPSLLDEGSNDPESEIEVHPQRLRDIRDVGGAPTPEVPEDRGPGLPVRPRLDDDDASLSKFVYVTFDRALEELGA